MNKYRIQVTEEVAGAQGPLRYRARPDLSGAAEGDCFSKAKRVALYGLSKDKRFTDLTVISASWKDKTTLVVLVRSAHRSMQVGIPGQVYRAPAE